MTPAIARAVQVIGLAALVSVVLVLPRGDPWQFARVRGTGVVVLVVFGALAVVAGRLGRGVLALAAGSGFLVAAAVQLAQSGRSANLLGGNPSTVALFAGFGIGLLVLGVAARSTRNL